jgi:hypothetical protein
VYIAGTEQCQIQVEEPLPLVIALYLREVADLDPAEAADIPLLDPSVHTWPVWARRPPQGWRPPLTVRYAAALTTIDRDKAALQWDRWWRRLLRSDPTPAEEFHPPAFRTFRNSPALRLLLQKHYDDAARWAEAVTDDPRVKRDQAAPRAGLAHLVSELAKRRPAGAPPFRMRLTVVPVAGKHAWVVGPQQVLVTRHLIADAENMLDWLRPRARAMS